LGTGGYPLRGEGADVICGALAIDDVLGNHAPSVGIDLAFGRGTIVNDRLLLWGHQC